MIPEYFAYLTIIIGLVGAGLYIRGILYGTTRPNQVSWILWTIVPFVGAFVSYKSGISIPLLLSTIMAGMSPLLVVSVAFITKKWYLKTSIFDIGCGLLSITSIFIWITTANGIVALTFAILADLFAGIPTMVKSWHASETENVVPYSFGIVNQIITFMIIKDFSFMNIAFPIYFAVSNTIIILEVQRKFVSKLFKTNSLPADNNSHNK